MKTFAFNFKFTRPDENNEIVYHVGMNVLADTLGEAAQKLRNRNGHLTLIEGSVELFAVMDEDGFLLDEEGKALNPDACPNCGCEPGEGLTKGCNDPLGCGYWRNAE